MIFTPAQAARRPLTRLELVELCVSRLQNRFIDEVEAIRSGLLAPYPDGRMHLDWPATRGVAAGVLAHLAITLGLPPQPAPFADVGPSSPLAPHLAQVGALFPALEEGRFRSEQLAYREDLESMIASLQRPQGAASPTLPLPLNQKPVIGDFVGGRSFSQDPPTRQRPETDSPPGDTGTDTGAISRVSSVVPIDQLSPQSTFDLGQAREGIDEIESRLAPLETNVSELTAMQELTPEEDRKIIEALTIIGQVIDDALSKLAFAQRQLNAALLADPTAMRTALDLKARIVQDITRLERIRQRLEPRLRRPSPQPSEPTP